MTDEYDDNEYDDTEKHTVHLFSRVQRKTAGLNAEADIFNAQMQHLRISVDIQGSKGGDVLADLQGFMQRVNDAVAVQSNAMIALADNKAVWKGDSSNVRNT